MTACLLHRSEVTCSSVPCRPASLSMIQCRLTGWLARIARAARGTDTSAQKRHSLEQSQTRERTMEHLPAVSFSSLSSSSSLPFSVALFVFVCVSHATFVRLGSRFRRFPFRSQSFSLTGKRPLRSTGAPVASTPRRHTHTASIAPHRDERNRHGMMMRTQRTMDVRQRGGPREERTIRDDLDTTTGADRPDPASTPADIDQRQRHAADRHHYTNAVRGDT